MWLFYCFKFKRNYDVIKSKIPCILSNKNTNFHKNETKLKMKNPTRSFWETCYFSSYKNDKLKVKLWWAWTREKKKKTFFVPFILSEGNFFKTCILSQCIVYWEYFQNIYTFIYKKACFHTPFCLFSKSSKAFSVSLTRKKLA